MNSNINPITRKLNIIGLAIFFILSVFVYVQTLDYQWIFPAIGVGIFLIARAFNNELLFASVGYYGAVYVVFVSTYLYGVGANLHYAYITLCAIAFVIFQGKYRKPKISALVITGGLFCTNYIFPDLYSGRIEISEDVQFGLSAIFSSASFFVMLFLVGSYSRAVRKKETELRANIDTISEQKIALEQQSLLLSETQKLAHIGEWTYDDNENTVKLSKNCQSILEVNTTHFPLSQFLTHFPKREQKELERAIKGLYEGQYPLEREYKKRKETGELAIIKVIVARKQLENSQYLVFGALQDMTQIIENQELKMVSKNAEKLAEERAMFLAKMSHELRTPINGVSNLSDLLLKSKLNDTQKRYVDSIASSSETLLLLVNDILDISKINAGKMKLISKEFSLIKEAHLVHDIFSTKMEEKGLKFKLTISDKIPPGLIGDAIRLKQILFNLLGNAVKFTNKGDIEIVLQGDTNESGMFELQLKVSDSGIGIDSAKLESIFNPFIQVENKSDRSFGGTGLGLTIVKQLVELQGGTIAVDSKLKVGTNFNITIPYEVSEMSSTSNDFEEQGQEISTFNDALNILVVEDNPINQMIIVDHLENAGANVTVANNGQEGINYFEKGNYDIILMDMQMPVMDGYEAMKYIRNKLGLSKDQLPIVALTAHVLEGEKEKCLNAGANAYLTKPYAPQELLRLVSKLTTKQSVVKS